MQPEMKAYKIAIRRGGTSKGIFIKENELPKNVEQRNEIIRQIFGSPDPRQIDGLAGADVLTSKLAIIGPSTREDCDIDYTFAQVSFDTDFVDYGGNCGNISAAVGPFAIDEGLVKAVEPITQVRIHQTNTNCVLLADVPVKDGKAAVYGDCAIDGVPGTSASIMLNFYDTVGTSTGKLLPTGNPTDVIEVEGYGNVEVSIVDAGNVLVFIEAETLGLKGTESCAEIEANKALTDKIEAIRAACTVKVGLAKTCAEATTKSPYNPFVAIVSKPADYVCAGSNKSVNAADVDVVSRLSFMLHMHKTYPGTGTVCTGAAARIRGTLVYKQLSEAARKEHNLRIGHPAGVIIADTAYEEKNGELCFTRLAFERTQRLLLEGIAYVKENR